MNEGGTRKCLRGTYERYTGNIGHKTENEETKSLKISIRVIRSSKSLKISIRVIRSSKSKK
jgi:hypothetical protein